MEITYFEIYNICDSLYDAAVQAAGGSRVIRISVWLHKLYEYSSFNCLGNKISLFKNFINELTYLERQ